jgi:hypothetical protein
LNGSVSRKEESVKESRGSDFHWFHTLDRVQLRSEILSKFQLTEAGEDEANVRTWGNLHQQLE